MSKIPTLEECEIVAGSFATEPSLGGTYLIVTDRGRKKTIADFDDEDFCRLVAHRCNTFEDLLAACEAVLLGLDMHTKSPDPTRDNYVNPVVAATQRAVAETLVRSAIAKAKGTTP